MPFCAVKSQIQPPVRAFKERILRSSPPMNTDWPTTRGDESIVLDVVYCHRCSPVAASTP